MIRPHAQAIAAHMIDSVSFGNRANEKLMTHAVSCHHLTITPDLPIATAGLRSLPDPAIVMGVEGLLDLFDKSFFK